jgi:hypothetical protein
MREVSTFTPCTAPFSMEAASVNGPSFSLAASRLGPRAGDGIEFQPELLHRFGQRRHLHIGFTPIDLDAGSLAEITQGLSG